MTLLRLYSFVAAACAALFFAYVPSLGAQLVTINTGNGKGDAFWEYSVDQISWSPAVEVSTALFEANGSFSWALDSYSPFSRWISVSTNFADMNALSGQTYWYRASFQSIDSLPISGRMLVDDTLQGFSLNGADQAITGGGNWPGPWFHFQTPAAAIVGTNMLTLAVRNGGNAWTGIRVEASVPEPSTYALLFMSGAGMLWWGRRKR
jgi:hypothetical protein